MQALKFPSEFVGVSSSTPLPQAARRASPRGQQIVARLRYLQGTRLLLKNFCGFIAFVVQNHWYWEHAGTLEVRV